jgi:phospholipid transport system transporter-binding protein
MNSADLQSLGNGRYRLSGDLDFDTVPVLLAQGAVMFAQQTGGPLMVDLSGVKRTTSVGVALMIDWLRRARNAQTSIEFHNVPAQMLAMAKLSGLESILPLAANGPAAPGAAS